MGLNGRNWYGKLKKLEAEQKPDVRYDPKQFRRPRPTRDPAPNCYAQPTRRHLRKPRATSRGVIGLAWVAVVVVLYAVFTLAGRFHP